MILHNSSTSDISSYQLLSAVFLNGSKMFKVFVSDVSAMEFVTPFGLRLPQGPTTAAVRLRKAVDSLLQKVPAQVGPPGPCDASKKRIEDVRRGSRTFEVRIKKTKPN